MTTPFDSAVLAHTSTTGVYWALEDVSGTTSAADSSGNGNALTCTSFTFGEPGIVPSDSDTCALLTSSSHGNSSYQPSFSAFSIGAVINCPTVPTASTLIAGCWTSTDAAEIRISASGKPVCVVGNGTSNITITGPTALTAGHTCLVVATWDGTTVTLYTYDITARTEFTAATGSLSGSLTSGAAWDVGGSTFAGYIGRVFGMPVALTSTQVAALYTAAQATVAGVGNVTVGALNPSVSTGSGATPFDELVEEDTAAGGIFWALEDAAGTTTAADSSGNGNTLATTDFTFGTAGIVPSDSKTCAALTTSSIARSSYLPSYTNGVTFGAIVRFASVPTTAIALLNDASATAGADLRIGSSGVPFFVCANGTTQISVDAPSALVANHTYLLVGTWDGSSTVTMYVYDLTAGTSMTPGTGSLSAGSGFKPTVGFSLAGNTMTGDLARVFVAAGALSSTRVALYASTAMAAIGTQVANVTVGAHNASVTTSSAGGGTTPPPGYAWLGAYPGPGGDTPPATFEEMLNDRLLGVFSTYEALYAWTTGTGWENIQTWVAEGRILAVDLSARIPASDGGGYAQWLDIANGVYDSELTTLAQDLGEWGQPFFMGFCNEFDGGTWQNNSGGSDPIANFVAAYQHLYNLMAPLAPNIVWVWGMSGNNLNTNTAAMYPGDEYVDWITADPYDETMSKGGSGEPANGPMATYQPFVEWLAAQSFGNGKPIGLFETGVDQSTTGSTGDQNEAIWLENVPAALVALDIRMWIWFNSSGTLGNTAINPGSDSAAALATIGANAVFNPTTNLNAVPGTAGVTAAAFEPLAGNQTQAHAGVAEAYAGAYVPTIGQKSVSAPAGVAAVSVEGFAAAAGNAVVASPATATILVQGWNVGLAPTPAVVPPVAYPAGTVPHLAVPFQIGPTGIPLIVQQDSIDDLTSCVQMALGCVKGTRLAVPDFGVSDPTFTGVDVGELENDVALYEPRVTTDISVSWPDGDGEANVTALVYPVANSAS